MLVDMVPAAIIVDRTDFAPDKPMTVALDKTKDQRLVHSGMTWQQFELLQESFADSPGVQLAFYKGEIEILTVSSDHESISRMIHALLTVNS